MTAATHELTSLEMGDDVPSTSCSEEIREVREPSVRARSAWKVGAVAAAVALIVVAGSWWTPSKTAASWWTPSNAASDQTTSLATYYAYPAIGCSNWASIFISKAVTTDKAACATLCDSTPECAAFDWQATPCEPGWFVSNGCMLFKDGCSAERNTCWEMNYQWASTTAA